MHKWNLFKRIERREGENFATEILAYVLETDPTIKKTFLKLLLSQLPRNRRSGLRKAFRSCEIRTQQPFGFGIPDMTITPAGGRGAMVFVEVKTQAQEGDGQVRKYLKHGHVAYLTPRGHDEPDLGGADDRKYQYLGHFYWDHVYSAIEKSEKDRRGSHNVLHKQFLEYLEARRMTLPGQISKRDLNDLSYAAGVLQKFQALVEAVRKEIEPDWKHEFGENLGGKKAAPGVQNGDLPSWWFRGSRRWKRWRGTYLCIGVYPDKGEGQPRLYVGLCTERRKFGVKLETDKKLGKLCNDIRWKWDPDGPPDYWGYYKTFPVGVDSVENIARRQIKNVRSEGRNIRKLVEFVEKKMS